MVGYFCYSCSTSCWGLIRLKIPDWWVNRTIWGVREEDLLYIVVGLNAIREMIMNERWRSVFIRVDFPTPVPLQIPIVSSGDDTPTYWITRKTISYQKYRSHYSEPFDFTHQTSFLNSLPILTPSKNVFAFWTILMPSSIISSAAYLINSSSGIFWGTVLVAFVLVVFLFFAPFLARDAVGYGWVREWVNQRLEH